MNLRPRETSLSGKDYIKVQLTLRIPIATKAAFPKSSEAKVFYENLRRQFMSTVISVDEILWKFLLSLGAHRMIKARCKTERATHV